MSHRGRKLYLDKENAKISGVCAGIADYFGWDPTVVRIGFVAGTIFGSGVMIVVYVLMAWLLDPKPLGLSYRDDRRYDEARTEIDESRRAVSTYRPRQWRFSDVKHRFGRVEDRLRTLEQVVTSREFQVDRELRGTGRI